MQLIFALKCHLDALTLVKHKKILAFLAALRFLILIAFIVIFSWVALSYNDTFLNYIWEKPSKILLTLVWYIVLIFSTIILLFAGAILAYIISQILFGILIADYMSALAEQIITGKQSEEKISFSLTYLIYLIRQEIPRTLFPLILSTSFMVFGWLLPLNFIWVILSSFLSCALMAWDYTDLVPARRSMPFKERLHMFKSNFVGHIVFGLPFLIPFVNVIFLSLAPISGTVFFLKEIESGPKHNSNVP